MQRSSYQAFQILHHRLELPEHYKVHITRFHSKVLGGLYRVELFFGFLKSTYMKLENFLFISHHKEIHTYFLYHALPNFEVFENLGV